MTQQTNRIGLTTRQTILSAIIGVVLWFAAAMLLRALEGSAAFEGGNRAFLYAAVVIGTVPFIPMTRIIAGLPLDKVGTGVALATASAMLLDGIALAWFPGLYGTTVEHIANSGAAILWGAGVAVMLGFGFNRAAD